MKTIQNCKKVLIAVLLVMVFSPTWLHAAHAERPTGNELLLISEDRSGLTLELQVPWQAVQIEPRMVDNQPFTQVSIPGWAGMDAAGSPSLPYFMAVIGVPFGVDISLNVVAGEAHTEPLSALVVPALTEEVDWQASPWASESSILSEITPVVQEDPQIYESQSVYPGVFAEIVNDGFLRNQRLVSIGLYPIQYDLKDNSLIVYETLQIRVEFDGSMRDLNQTILPDSPAYEGLFEQTLLNYKQAREWRRSPTGNSVPAGLTVEILPGGQVVPTSGFPFENAWRIRVRETGFYQITYGELAAGGLPVTTLDPRNLQIFSKGAQMAIEVPGEGDGIFNDTDSLLFYGEAIDNKYTLDNVYWLVLGDEPGLRISSRDATPSTAPAPTSYVAEKFYEDNNYYITLIPGEDDFERFFWDRIFAQNAEPASWTHDFSLVSPVAGTGKLSLSMMGYSSHEIAPDHHVSVAINGTTLGETWWDGITWKNVSFDIPSGLLTPGINNLTLTCPNDTGVGYDIVYIDWVRLEYQNSFTAEADWLAFEYDLPGTWKYQVNGFTHDTLSVYDISDPLLPVKLTNITTIQDGSLYSALFEDEVIDSKVFYALSSSTYKPVEGIEADTPSSLQSPVNGADYLIITPDTFWSAAQNLADHRAAQGLRSMIVDVQDVYDEFGYGIAGATPIHDFLSYAYYNWEPPAPAFVVLLGNGNYDPKNYLGDGETSHIPPYLAMADPNIGETAADNRYVTISGNDHMPEMMLGRLAVNNLSEANAFVNKIITYELSSAGGDWIQKVLMVADNADDAGDFAALSDSLLSTYLLDTYEAEKVYFKLTHPTVEDARAAIIGGVNNGKIITNYVGHAAYTQWEDDGIFRSSDVSSLINSDKLPVVLAMTCYEGYFHSPKSVALAEMITRWAGGGAVASWSPSGASVAQGHDYLNHGFFKAFFHNGAETVGEATITGKLMLWGSGYNLDLLDTYLIFGDPAQVFLRPLTAVYDSYYGNQDTVLSVSTGEGVLKNDINPENLTIWAELTGTTANGSLVFNPDGSFTYTPDEGWYGYDSFTYRLTDGEGYSNNATVTITVFKENHPPTDITLSNSTIYENWPINTEIGQFSTTDPDIGDTFTYRLVDGEGGTDNASFNIDRNKLRSSVRFNYEAQSEYSIRVRTTDQRGNWFEKIFTIHVQDLNDAPVAVDDAFTTPMNTPLVLDASELTVNDTDEDDDELTVLRVSDEIEGSVTLIGHTITFTPTSDYTGIAGFDYTVYDGRLIGKGHVVVMVTENWIYLPLIQK